MINIISNTNLNNLLNDLLNFKNKFFVNKRGLIRFIEDKNLCPGAIACKYKSGENCTSTEALYKLIKLYNLNRVETYSFIHAADNNPHGTLETNYYRIIRSFLLSICNKEHKDDNN